MNHASLFNGIGGFQYAAELVGWNNIMSCEIDPFCNRVTKYHYPNCIQHGDIKETDFTIYRGRVDVLTGGFPCQDASIAKQDGYGQQGLDGDRTGLFYEMCRAIREIKPRFIVAENVANILKTNRGKDFSRILTELSAMGYNAEWRVCRASEVGASHHRARLYLVAYSDSIRMQQGQTFFSNVREKKTPFSWRAFGTVVQIVRGGAWEAEPPILCVDDGIPSGLARKAIHGYGNAIVPQVAVQIFKAINQFANSK